MPQAPQESVATGSARPSQSSLYALTLFVEDLSAARAFYARAFDLPAVFEDAHSVVFQVGATLVNLLDIAEAPVLVEPAAVGRRDAGARAVYTIHVDDVDAVCEQMRARGVTFLNGPMDRPWGVRTATWSDPFGHLWEIAR